MFDNNFMKKDKLIDIIDLHDKTVNKLKIINQNKEILVKIVI